MIQHITDTLSIFYYFVITEINGKNKNYYFGNFCVITFSSEVHSWLPPKSTKHVFVGHMI